MSSGIEKFINREWITRVEIEVIIEETAISTDIPQMTSN